ncbi:MAG: Ribonuclease 3 [Candidatus Anoxychlamydiales bacterium]|nr:Ribonuclease 3 [Candidatus Anoxychlamydiales bacterium]
MFDFNKLKKNIDEIQNKINYFFKNKDLLIEAFIHKSYLNENKDIKIKDNERLEFLGDSVLSLIISDFLFNKLPSSDEGKLSHIRSLIVNATQCEIYFEKLNLNDYILLSKGEIKAKRKSSISANALEALIGAIYVDSGYEKTKLFLLNHFEDMFLDILKNPKMDNKSTLQEYAQKKYNTIPEYKLINAEGPEHEKIFFVQVYVNNEPLGKGSGSCKKTAEQNAANDALSNLK